jgi:hypothetical protein
MNQAPPILDPWKLVWGTDGRAFLDDPKLKPQIEENWRFIFSTPPE